MQETTSNRYEGASLLLTLITGFYCKERIPQEMEDLYRVKILELLDNQSRADKDAGHRLISLATEAMNSVEETLGAQRVHELLKLDPDSQSSTEF